MSPHLSRIISIEDRQAIQKIEKVLSKNILNSVVIAGVGGFLVGRWIPASMFKAAIAWTVSEWMTKKIES